MLKAEDIIFSRNQDGDLIPQEVELNVKGIKSFVKVVPLTRGKIQEIYTKAQSNDASRLEADNDVLRYGLVEPLLTENQIKDLKPNFANAITTVILAVSLGISQEEVTKQAKQLLDKEQELKKN